ncbi:MAG: UvrD-helicase domain-containing protein [Candidatus Binatus sp.]|uniref:UvrD-helicase domain-containing protein n=1 Tax=Candidatus Binatus sp. TaxID=2811406 RepID=UPI003C788108
MSATEYHRPAILDQILDGRHKVIDASAGTGKTFTIEQIVVDLLRTGTAQFDQILIVTFTEKATAELRSRIRATIEAVLSGHDLADGERDRLRTALDTFHHAPIHTIHSFCHRMLTELAFDSGVRFGLDLARGRLEFHEAIRAELRERLKSDESVQRLIAEWFSDEGRTSAKLEDLLWRAHAQRYLRTAGRDLNQQALTDLASAFDAEVLIDAYQRAAITEDARLEAIAATEELKLIVDQANGSTRFLAQGLCSFNLDRICDPKSVRRTRNEKRPLFPDQMTDRVRLVINATERVQAALAIDQRLVDELLPAVVNRMDARKRERGTLDYEDMLAWLADALEGPRGKSLAATLRDRYRVTLIDEFQDTDELQWKIFREVFVEGGGGNLVYVIGDPKQAIYGFRGADVHAYLEACKQLSEAGATTVPLRENFRSTSEMIDACNLLFDQSASVPLFNGEITYSHPVTCGSPALRAIATNGESIVPVTLLKFQPRDDRYKFSRRMREAIGMRIAQAISRIILEPEHAIKICDEGKEPRRISARDVYVLTRTNRESAEIGKYLRQAGVPYAFYKQDGLFQTREAAYILDVLRGIDEPGRRSNRLRAWATPFFAVDHSDLARLDDERNSQPMLERLFEWRALAEAGRFADLFDALLHQSGLVERELLLSDGRRDLTNYEHIFEILIQNASRHGVVLAEIIEFLDAYISERTSPAGDDPNVQRFEDDRDAVQVMTIHKSKGLEADVVALYGGFFASTLPDPVSIFHLGNEQRLAIGKPARELAKIAIAKEKTEEDQRLLYVALTRERAKLLLPYVPDDTLTQDLRGSYKQLNDRLRTLDCDARTKTLFTTEAVVVPEPTDSTVEAEKVATPLDDSALCDWLESTSRPAGLDGELADLGTSHRGLIIESYTSLQAAEPDEFKTSVDAIDARGDNIDLPGGRHVGIFLHEAIEKLDFKSFGDALDLQAWMARKDVRELFASAMRRRGVNDPRWLERGREIVFNALTSKVALGETELGGGLFRLPEVREMEFAYPIPERHHTMLGDGPDGAWTVGRGYIKGFIDLVFRRDNLMYFADWKGDLLPSYEPAAVARHVDRHYRLQARIYSVGVVRLLAIHNEREYDSRFGGLLYVFLRGVLHPGDGKTGFYFARPSWNEIVTYESELMNDNSDSELFT